MVAVALVAGSVGTTLDIVLAGSSSTSLPAAITGIASVSPTAGGSTGTGAGTGTGTGSGSGRSAAQGVLRVAFTVTNPTGGTVLPVCELRVGEPDGRSGVATMPPGALARLAAGASATGHVDVRVGNAVAAGSAPHLAIACHS